MEEIQEDFIDPALLPKTVAEMDDFVTAMFAKRKVIEEKQEEMKVLNKEMAKLEAQAVAALKQLGRSSYKTENGTVSIRENWSVRVPQDLQAKQAFFTYLEQKGGDELLFKYASVNYQSLNSFWKEEFEIAKSEGRAMEFKVPGIGEPTLFESLMMRKK